MREPTLAWWPGRVPAGRVAADLASTMDLLATFCHLAQAEIPKDCTLDSYNLTPVLLGEGRCPRDSFFYYRGYTLMAVRQGAWKAHFLTQTGYGQAKPESHDPPLLFNLEIDPGEKYNVAKDHPEIVTVLKRLAEEHQAGMQPAPSQLEL